MQYFVHKESIVRKIWGSSDTVLFIFAGASAEFALNKAVDWLYFTGKLPSDPLGRLFSTVGYARQIVFAPAPAAEKAIYTMAHIHAGVEKKRGYSIPDWAYRDVLFMLIYYSIAAFELLNRPLTAAEKEEVYHVFYRVGVGMGVRELPPDYISWLPVRAAHLENDLLRSHYTVDLFKQYRKHLAPVRYMVLLEAQKLVVPGLVRKMLHLHSPGWIAPIVPVYKFSKKVKMDFIIRHLLLPPAYKKQIDALDVKDD